MITNVFTRIINLRVASNAINARRLPLAPLVYALMTTSVGNNSVLSTEDKENYLEHPIPEAPVAPLGQQVPPVAVAAHDAWVKGQKEVVVLMLFVTPPFLTYSSGS
ncbi:hypothetical protein Tco_0794174 [Tanacetum coccineum]